ncbi:MAG: C25 family cysteine peptidase [Bacteriovorax sp.]|jgi:hypothetical protein
MKMLPLALSLLSFFGVAHAKVSVDKHIDSTIYKFNVDSVQVASKMLDGQKFSVLALEGVKGYEAIDYKIGNPELPIISFNVAADDLNDIRIREISEDGKSFMRVLNLKPNLASVPKIAGAKYQFTKSLVYNSREEFPSVHYSVIPNGQIRGQKQFLVKLFPLSFVGANQEVKLARSYQIEVKNPANKSSTATSKTMLYIVGEKFKTSASLTQYIALKNGLNEKSLRLEVKKGMKPLDIRNQIKQIYKANPDLSYALIIGDAEDVVGYTSANNMIGFTDHYFAAIDTNDYESDIFTPDLFVGRIAVANEAQLATVLKKYTRYIKGTFTNTNWLGELSFLATNDRYEVAEGSHNYAIDTYTKEKGFHGNYPLANQEGGDKLYAITHNAENQQVMNSITEGRAIIDYSGHGANTFWDAPRVEQSDVRALKHTSLPFVVSNACITGDYRVSESFAETWQRHEWGAIMFWGSMDSTYWDEDDILERAMFDGIFKFSKKEFGEITKYANAEVSRFYSGEGRSKYYWETYHMFGDPSIQLRLK